MGSSPISGTKFGIQFPVKYFLRVFLCLLSLQVEDKTGRDKSYCLMKWGTFNLWGGR